MPKQPSVQLECSRNVTVNTSAPAMFIQGENSVHSSQDAQTTVKCGTSRLLKYQYEVPSMKFPEPQVSVETNSDSISLLN